MGANLIPFDLTAKDAENLWFLISTAQMAKLHADPGVPFAVYELRLTLQEMREEPEDELGFGTPKRIAYCKERDVSTEYFPKTMQWEVPRRLLIILKLVLKASIATSTGLGVSEIVTLCKTLRLSAWFKKTFKKPVNVDLGEDDCELDDEMDGDELDAEDEADAKPASEAAD